MPDDPLAGLMRSPLDDEPSRRGKQKTRSGETGPGSGWWPLPVAVFAGGLITIAALLAAGSGSDGAEDPPPATPASPSTTLPAPSTGLPPGYIALNARVGARPERLLIRDGAGFLSFTLATRAGLDPAGTAGFSGGQWTVELRDGSSAAALGEFLDPFAPGTFTVAFPMDGLSEDDIAALVLTGEAIRAGTSHIMQVAVEGGLPWEGTPGSPLIQLESNLDFVVDEVILPAEGGSLVWHLEGDPEPGAVVAAQVRLFGASSFPLGALTGDQATTFFSFFGSAVPPHIVARSGTAELTGGVARPSTVERAEITWNIDWITYLPASARIPVEAVPVVTVAG